MIRAYIKADHFCLSSCHLRLPAVHSCKRRMVGHSSRSVATADKQPRDDKGKGASTMKRICGLIQDA